MELTVSRPVAPGPRAAAPAGAAGAAGFLGGVLAFQIVNNALHLAQPLLIIKLSGSMALAAGVASAETAVHMLGTALGGWPTDKLGARRMLIVSVLGRAAALAVVPAAWALGLLTLKVALAAYTLDAVIRGFYDTAVHAVPLELSCDRAVLDGLNSKYELAFDLGGVIGPLLLGAAFFSLESLPAQAAIALGFAGAALAFAFLPKPSGVPAPAAPRAQKKDGTAAGLKAILEEPQLVLACGALSMLNLYPLRKLLSVFFAKAVLSSAKATPWIGAAFGLGGMAGALVFSRWGRRLPAWTWAAAGAVGVLGLALGWIPGTFAAMAAGSFLFSLTNVGARLVMTRLVQEGTPAHLKGGVTAVARSGSNIASVVLKALVSAAFAAGVGATGAFTLVAAGLIAVGLVQAAVALKLRADGVQ